MSARKYLDRAVGVDDLFEEVKRATVEVPLFWLNYVLTHEGLLIPNAMFCSAV